MKIFKSKDIALIDKLTIEKEPIVSIDLMERAATTLVQWILSQHPSQKGFVILCGTGNNGGDGLAIARLLVEQNKEINTYIIKTSNNSLSPDAAINLKRLQKISKAKLTQIESIEELPPIPKEYIIIDALFGTGLNKPITEGLYANVIKHINSISNKVISIDTPSGLFGEENHTIPNQVIIKATYTLTLEFPKIAQLLAENEDYIGELCTIPIKLHPQAKKEIETNYHYLQNKNIAPLLKKRKKHSHKGNYGHALLIAGNEGTVGAAILAAQSCMRSGVGLLTCCLPKKAHTPLHTTLPEAMTTPHKLSKQKNIKIFLKKYTATAIGCGIGETEHSLENLKTLIKNTTQPLILDADAINLLGKNPKLINQIPPNSILTPHPKEFERLAGTTVNHYQRLQKLLQLSIAHKIYIILKGANTSIATPKGECYINSTGNPGMAKGGSGDILTGILLSLLAQGYTHLHTCLAAVYLHGLAGDITAQKLEYEYMTPSDVVRNLTNAFRTLKNN